MENKMTKLQVVEMMLKEDCISANEVYKAYLENEKMLLEKKSANKRNTKVQEANISIKAEIINALRNAGIPLTVTDIQKLLNNEYSNQKISALITQLKNDNIVTKVTEKGKSLFSIAITE